MTGEEVLMILPGLRLVCPNCRGDLEHREADQVVACLGACKYEYPVVDGRPHMLIDEARKP